ncbi:ATP-binding cassette domain-containing protein [Paenibacillus senegalensis]|uniref:ATP-binding cassette domain-containing protein n=1 Tax=Paenibacillus senegalensis TaxID=1465766 RepID=UPI0004752E72|nr:ATP-binding cassette domain-containing protein [Paenibacillus senegalensis]
MIIIDKLCKQFKSGPPVLDQLSLTIDQGIFGLLGPNGAGKTTLIKIMAAILAPSSGSITMKHLSLTKEPDKLRHMIGYLPQSFQVYPQLTGYEFMEHIALIKGLTHPRQRQQEIEGLLDQLNLGSKAYQKVKTYSSGMKQRLGIAQAMLGQPEVLIVDEPTAGLDPEEKVNLRNVLSEFGENRIILMSTHIVADIECCCQRIAVLNQGRICFQGTQKQLLEAASGYVWEAELEEAEWIQYADKLSVKLLRTRPSAKGFVHKLITDNPNDLPEHAVPIDPTLEDAYLAVIGGAGQ